MATVTATLTPEPASGAVAVRSENRVRDFSPLSWPRVGVEVPISLERTGENGSVYDDSRRQILNYLRARYYDPTTAQFLSRDPLVDSTMSPYAYVNGNPLNASDPLGLWGISISCDACGNFIHAAANVVVDTENDVKRGAGTTTGHWVIGGGV